MELQRDRVSGALVQPAPLWKYRDTEIPGHTPSSATDRAIARARVPPRGRLSPHRQAHSSALSITSRKHRPIYPAALKPGRYSPPVHKPPPLLSPHRTARFIRWAVLMLEWLAALLFADAPADRRRIRQRCGLISFTWAHRLLRALVIVRTVQLGNVRARPGPPPRNAAPAGFHRRIRRAATARATFGARARKALHARTTLERIRRLLAAFSDIDGFTRRYMLARARRRLTRLCAITMLAPPAEAVRALAVSALTRADTS